MAVRVSWKVLALLVAIVIAALLLVVHVVGWYVQMAVFALLAVIALAMLVRHGFRRASYAVRGRGRGGDPARRG
jgi:membrane protein implicated in regulation of membrane protease activity